jgi:hypothetical protein
VVVLNIVALWGLPGAALLGFSRWAQPRLSRKAVLWGAAVSFLLPMLLALVPIGWQLEMEGVDDKARALVLQAVGVVLGFVIFFTLMPLVLALVAGVAGAALRVKSVVPASTTPGLFLAGASYLQALMLFIMLVTVHLVASNVFLVLGTLLWVGAPLVYVLGAGRLVPSLSAAEAARHIRTLRGISGALVGVSAVLFVVYLTTTEVFGKQLVPDLLSPWKLLEMVLSYTGRLLFIGVLGLDVLLRVDLAVWLEGQRFAATPEAAEHARLMERLRRGLEGADAAGQ